MATATIVTSNVVQPAKAAYSKDVIAPNAQTGTWGSQVSSAPQEQNSPGGLSTHNGIADWRANGDKYNPSTGDDYIGPGNNGKGGPNFSPPR